LVHLEQLFIKVPTQNFEFLKSFTI